MRNAPADPLQAIQCPDCDSIVTVIGRASRLTQVRVEHDDSCPWYTDLKRRLT
jgi:hypothetical protein